MENIFFVSSSPFLSVLVTSFSFKTVFMYFSVFLLNNKKIFKIFFSFFYDQMIIIVRSIMKSYGYLFKYTTFETGYAMRSIYIFPCIMAMISNFTIYFHLSHIYFQILLNRYNRFFHLHMIPAAHLLITSFFYLKLIFFIAMLS